MHDKEIQYFTNALQQAGSEFYLDAISEFRKLIEEFPNSELADDALYNIGLCYFQMNQFEKAIEHYQLVIDEHPNATISVLDGGNEFGKTAAKCHYAIMNCYLGQGEVDKAKQVTDKLHEYDKDSYVLVKDNKVTFKELSEKALKTFLNS